MKRLIVFFLAKIYDVLQWANNNRVRYEANPVSQLKTDGSVSWGRDLSMNTVLDKIQKSL